MGLMESFESEKIIETNNNELSFLSVGDIVWAKRYKNDDQKEKIEKGHQESPYVIIKKTKDKVYGLLCTSNPHQEVKWKMLYYHLGRLNYGMKKSSFIFCSKVYHLEVSQIIEIKGSLNEYDLNQLKKQLYIIINSNFRTKPKIERQYLDFTISIGDVISKNDNRYYIYAYDSVYFYVNKLRKGTKINRSILINNTYYSFIFNRHEKIQRNSSYTLVDTFNSGEIEMINDYRIKIYEELKRVKEHNTLKIGAIINYKTNLYYIYDEDNENVFVYQIFPKGILEPKMAYIKINTDIYRTYFATRFIKKETLKRNGYSIKKYASKEEIDYNNKMLSIPKKERKREVNKLFKSFKEKNIDNFLPMTIIENEINKQYYLIIDREGNVIEIVNINDFKDKFYFELEKGKCPFNYYRILSKEEYFLYLKKIQDLKAIVAIFDK